MFQAPVVPYVREADFAVREPWYLGARRLYDYLLIYVQEGDLLVWVEGRQYRLNAGEFCLIQPNECHTLEGVTPTITPYAHFDVFYGTERNRSTTRFQMGRSPLRYRSLVQPRLNDMPGLHIPVKFVPPNAGRFRGTLLNLIGVWQQGDEISHLESQYLATGLLLTLLKTYSRQSSAPVERAGMLNWVTTYLSFRLADPVSVAEMAQRAGFSPSHFANLFRKHFGCPPHRYLVCLRLEHARDLLESTTYTLQEIARRSGFANAQHFARTFKQETGETPGAYRRRTQK